ncbi:energy transducer TonB [Emticicia sp. BO119]|uniref:energy transducer TonB n=1 Tax=Emticicia sp. BO119 TaxID=2757768 RepID=UPI0015F0E9CD|nr:energy transducer TonB [Emticicia sp. BO119]MBA4851809.1 energy transducer TonB [Emticicia sp. BO119]
MLKTLILIGFSSVAVAQGIREKVVGDWIKEDIRLKDGSPILDKTVRDIQLRYIFEKNGTSRVVYDGRAGDRPYQVNHDTLIVGGDTFYKIEEVSDIKMVLQQITADSSATALKIMFTPAHLYNVGFMPEKYRTKGGDTIYVFKPNYLEPFFIDADMNASHYISENFDFPEFRTGDFYTRFIITKNGEVKGIEILRTTNDRYNNKLIAAIKKSEGKWKPAMWEGKPVNVEVMMGFDFGWTEKQTERSASTSEQSEDEKLQESNEYLAEGKYYLTLKNYNEAIRNYTWSLDKNPLNIDAYYGRASAYAMKKDTKKMCEDLLHLKNLQQAKGTELWNKFCNK